MTNIVGGRKTGKGEAMRERVGIISPFKSEKGLEWLRNIDTAEKLCRRAVGEGFAPFAPHLFYTYFLNDDDP